MIIERADMLIDDEVGYILMLGDGMWMYNRNPGRGNWEYNWASFTDRTPIIRCQYGSHKVIWKRKSVDYTAKHYTTTWCQNDNT